MTHSTEPLPRGIKEIEKYDWRAGFWIFVKPTLCKVNFVAKPAPQNGFEDQFYVREGEVSRLARLHDFVTRRRKVESWGGRRALLIYLH